MKLEEDGGKTTVLPATWIELPVQEAVTNISISGRKIPQKLYLKNGLFPVIDQGQNYIGGYTNDELMLVDCELPVIIFGDHTKVIKRANQRFAAGADGVKVLKPLPFLDQSFSFYVLLNAASRLKSKGYARHFQDFSKSKINIPPLSEQVRIVAKLEEMFSELEKGVENLHTVLQQLQVYRQALLKHAFEGKLTSKWRAQNPDKLESAESLLVHIPLEAETYYQQQLHDWQDAQTAWGASRNTSARPAKPKVPKAMPPLTSVELAELPQLPPEWAWIKYGDLCSMVRNGISAKPEGNSGEPIFRISAVRPLSFDMNDIRFIDNSSGVFDNYFLKRGDLVFTRYNGSRQYVGVCAEYKSEDRRLFPDKLVQTRVFSTVHSTAYLEKALNAGASRQFVESRIRTTAGQSGISGDDIKSIPVPICSSFEQLRIVEILDSKLSALDQLEENITDSLQRAEALRRSILQKAFSGLLVEQHSGDEPANVLVERIRAERAAQPEKARGRKAQASSRAI